MFKATDNKIIEFYQKVYTWIWDNTGITKGLICFISIGIVTAKDFFKALYEPSIMQSMLIALVLWILYLSYAQHQEQVKEKYNKLNSKALKERNDFFDMFIRFFIMFAAIMSMSIVDEIIIRTIYAISAITYFYLQTVMVTNRKIPDRKAQFSYNPT